jgi:hypothetical protein
MKYVAYPNLSVANPETAPERARVSPKRALRSAYWVAAYRFSQMLMTKARYGVVPSPPQKDSTAEAVYISPVEGGNAAAVA